MQQNPPQKPGLDQRQEDQAQSKTNQLGFGPQPAQLLHLQSSLAQAAQYASWPSWLEADLLASFKAQGIKEPYRHQVQLAEQAQKSYLSQDKTHLIMASGTASGKSLAYLLPSLNAIVRDQASVLYLCPTKALAADQLTALHKLKLTGLTPASYDGDTPTEERAWIRQHSNFILTNPDMLHFSLLSQHSQWRRFLRNLAFVILDEVHHYRGVFGAHCALLLRRLRRICRHYGVDPVFIAASATSAEPAQSFAHLLGVQPQDVQALTHDTSPRGEKHILLWEPGASLNEQEQQQQQASVGSALTDSARMLASLVSADQSSIVFVKSRRAAEALAQLAQQHLERIKPSYSQRVQAYRAGFLPQERRQLEADLRSGKILGMVATSALELGIDISGLAAVIVAGWPGSRASFFQQIGRAGRSGQASLAVFVAGQDPLDNYLVHHPEDIFTLVEANVFDPHNPYLLSPHLCAAAAELPLREEEIKLFGPSTPDLLHRLGRQGYLRQRATGWFWTGTESASQLVDLRSGAGKILELVDLASGAVIGSMDSNQALHQGHPGAIYTHQGQSYLVEELDLAEAVISLRKVLPTYYTQARDLTDISILTTERSLDWGPVQLRFGQVKVRTQVVSFQRKSLPGQENLGEESLELPAQNLRTKAFWLAVPKQHVAEAGIEDKDLAGALHAAEHAAIGLLPLFATCDHWDIGGLSTPSHKDTGLPTIFVYDGQQGGAGFAERGFEASLSWFPATLKNIASCRCSQGCPSCVQSPRCGSRNEPLAKEAAQKLLKLIIAAGSSSAP